MSRLLAKYVSKDIGRNYEGDIVGYFRELACYEGIEMFRDAVFAIPKQVEKNFDAIVDLEKLRKRGDDIRGVLLARSLTHNGLKRQIKNKFGPRSINFHSIQEQYIKQLLNSPELCRYIDTTAAWSAHSLRSYFTKDSPDACLHFLIDSAARKRDAKDVIGDLCVLKPKLIRYLRRSHFESLDQQDVIRLLGKLNTKKILNYVIDREITLDSDASEFIGQVISMESMQGTWMSPGSKKIYRLLST